MDFAQYVLRKGITRHELGTAQPTTDSCSLIREATSRILNDSVISSPAEELKPAKFASIALWYAIIKTIYERVASVRDTS